MNKMTKEELIEWFVNNYGENEILNKFMTKEQIREKLNNLINEVRYENNNNFVLGCWNLTEKYLSFNMDLIENNFDLVIVHELLHVLSTSTKDEMLKCGLMFRDDGIDRKKINDFILPNNGINEGMTDALAQMIVKGKNLGYYNHGSYEEYVKILYILSTIIGEDIILEKYFDDITAIDSEVNDIFLYNLERKYGLLEGKFINGCLTEILRNYDLRLLRDTLKAKNLNNLIIDEKEFEEKIWNSLLEILRILEENEKNYFRLNIFFKVIYREYDRIFFSEKVISFFEKCNFNFEKMKNFYNQLGRMLNTSDEVIKEYMMNVMLKSSDIDIEDKIGYFNNHIYEHKTKEKIYILYKLIVESGKIKEDKFSKFEIFEFFYTSGKYYWLDSFYSYKYCDIGNYYKIIDANNELDNFCDKDGHIIQRYNINFDSLSNEDIERLSVVLPKENINILSEELKKVIVEHQELYGKQDTDISIIGNMLRLMYGKEEFYYAIENNGKITSIEIRYRKKII